MCSNNVRVEVLLKSNCMVNHEIIKHKCRLVLLNHASLREDVMINDFHDDPELNEMAECMFVSHLGIDGMYKHINVDDKTQFEFDLYKVQSSGPIPFDLELNHQSENAASHWCLPSSDFVGLWESLIFDSKIKHMLLNYVTTMMLFSEKNVDINIIHWNKLVLLHGPPGTGKTSLCKALSQKISIRFQHKFSYVNFLEINCHSLFSKWFSESGKLVSKMFQCIEDLIQDAQTLVVILIDEVESLAHCRKAAFSGNAEPSDSIRVVNALLTHLDRIKRHPNVLIFTTSNITEAIDIAMIDRADVKLYIGLPSHTAIYQILYSCVCELQRTGIIYTSAKLLAVGELEYCESDARLLAESLRLMEIARKCAGLSGRTVRKLPLLAHAKHAKETLLLMNSFLDALEQAVQDQFENRVLEVVKKIENL